MIYLLLVVIQVMGVLFVFHRGKVACVVRGRKVMSDLAGHWLRLAGLCNRRGLRDVGRLRRVFVLTPDATTLKPPWTDFTSDLDRLVRTDNALNCDGFVEFWCGRQRRQRLRRQIRESFWSLW